MSKFLSICLLLLLAFLAAPRLSYAQESFAYQTPQEWDCALDGQAQSGATNDVVNGEKYMFWAMQSNMNSLTKLIAGYPNCDGAVEGVHTSAFKSSALGYITTGISSMYANPPANTRYFAENIMENVGIVKPAYAQGIGYSGLRAILPLWRMFRNLAYIILVIVLVVIGFMIMFRMQLDAQTVISVQSALPNIVVTLVLITFSYAIVGLLIDMMYFLIAFLVQIFDGAGLLYETGQKSNAAFIQQLYQNSNFFTLFRPIVWREAVLEIPQSLAGQRFNDPFDHFLDDTLGDALFGLLYLGGSAIMLLLASLALIFSLVKIFAILINSYIQVILAVILGPIQLLFGAIPGQNTFRNWLLGVVGNLIVFPATILMFLLTNAIGLLNVGSAASKEVGTTIWSPPLLFGPDSEARTIVALITFGMFMITPNIIMAIKGAIAPQPFLPIGPGQIIQPIVGTAQTTLNVGDKLFETQRVFGRMFGGRGS